jgi:UDP-glucuronate 4-epimerase
MSILNICMSERGKILVTGAAGFIGMHTVLKLIHEGWDVTGLDNLNSYYSVQLKYSRLAQTGIFSKQLHDSGLVTSEMFGNYRFMKGNLENTAVINSLFESEQFQYVINLGAQAGVRYSLQNPHAYIKSNVNGFLNIIENCRQHNVKHLVYASSSSVYGLGGRTPFTENQRADTPASLYAATKKSNELIAHSYSHLFRLPTTGLRFFTVYGPWGRPDMAMFLFTESILNGIPIEVYGHGQMSRDFTYIDDAVDAIVKVIDKPLENSKLPYQIFNVGNSTPVPLLTYIHEIEKVLDKKALMIFKAAHPADVTTTHADISLLGNYIGYDPKTSVNVGIKNFVKWYLEYFQVAKQQTATA